jgi:hypothetical protein
MEEWELEDESPQEIKHSWSGLASLSSEYLNLDKFYGRVCSDCDFLD